MKIRVSEQGALIPIELLSGADELEVQQQGDRVLWGQCDRVSSTNKFNAIALSYHRQPNHQFSYSNKTN